jgi:hypothetical protein
VLQQLPPHVRQQVVVKNRSTGVERVRQAQFYVVEQLSTTLEEFLEQVGSGVLPIAFVLQILIDVGEALLHLLSGNVLHLDVKVRFMCFHPFASVMRKSSFADSFFFACVDWES